MARVVVIGAGAMGLAAAYHAAKAGHAVEVVEAGGEPGGMAAHFDLGGLSIERFYHFICTGDQPTFDLLAELDLADELRWTRTTMGVWSDGKLHPWGDPVSLLRYPGVSLLAKIRYGLLAFVSVKRDRWDAIEKEDAKSWITRWAGKEAYAKLWDPLLRLKFFDRADNVSATWIWTRVRRTGRSRKSMFEERLGYIEGGSETLVKRLVDRIEAMGGRIRLSTPATRVETIGTKVSGVRTPEGVLPADAVIMTVPTPLVSQMVPALPDDWKAKYDAIDNIGVCCLVFRLARSVSPHFWTNISDPAIEVPGIIEFSNLRPVNGDAVVFVPYYMPTSHPKWGWTDQQLLDEAFGYLQRLQPKLTRNDIVSAKVSRLKHAQPVCEPNFRDKLPPVETPVGGLQVADTCFYYPEDRGVSESVRFGREMAARIPA